MKTFASAKARVVIAMSGGVDSSVAAYLLKEAGYEVIGVTLQLRPCSETTASRSCCSPVAMQHARQVAGDLDILHYVYDCHQEFAAKVLAFSWQEYQGGRTPNPCVLCNQLVKFGLFLDYVQKFGAAYIATGHYVQKLEETPFATPLLARGCDLTKDQSYFLFSLDQAQLRASLFPLGAYDKPQVRQLATELKLTNAAAHESQDVCFVKDQATFANSLKERFGSEQAPEAARGVIVDLATGKVLGEHSGIHNFTIGQRRGLTLSLPTRFFVCKIEPLTKTVFVSADPESLAATTVEVSKLSWFIDIERYQLQRAFVQIRYRHQAALAEVRLVAGGERAVVKFVTPQRALTPGQAAVFYATNDPTSFASPLADLAAYPANHLLLGGGFIERVEAL